MDSAPADAIEAADSEVIACDRAAVTIDIAPLPETPTQRL